MSSEIAVKKAYDIASPLQMQTMAKLLKAHIVHNKLYTEISGKNYAHVEGWQFAGGMLGLLPLIVAVTDLSHNDEVKWQAECTIVSIKDPTRILGRGFAVCSNKEGRKKSFDEYAIMSMAQTRAIGKAYRNQLGWVMKLAGYESTPAEEMKNADGTSKEKSPEKPEEKELYCQGARKGGCPHGATISKSGYDYSMRMYGKALCRDCVKEMPAPKRK